MDENNITGPGSLVETRTPVTPLVSSPATLPRPIPGMQGIPNIPGFEPEKKKISVVEIVILVTISLIAVAAIVFAVYYYLQWNDAQSNVDARVRDAENVAREDQLAIDEANFAELEKRPYLEFTGPLDYGAVNFAFPRTWSIYIGRDATQGGDFEAYFNPGQVNPVGADTINALRMSIVDRPIESVRTSYDSMVKSGKLSHSVYQVGPIAGDRYDGDFSTNIRGSMVMFKVNDKTAIFRTDAELFRKDFDTLIQTIKAD